MKPRVRVESPAERIAAAIVRAVAYADVFDFPLRAHEVHRYMPHEPAAPETVREILANGQMVPARLTRAGDYYALPGREGIVAKRCQRARESALLWPPTRRYGALIARLPYVRLVAVTGSLAVNNADADADIDYLVVTAPGHVWLTRAAIILVVRLARRRHGVTLCPNFVLSETAMRMPASMFNARELAQMVPLAGEATYRRLREVNGWTESFLPNAAGLPDGTPASGKVPAIKAGPLRRHAERLLATAPGRRLERWEMERKLRRFGPTAPGDEAQFSADWCKGHFENHGQRIIAAYTSRLESVARAGAGNGDALERHAREDA